jgi:hypothetical protein
LAQLRGLAGALPDLPDASDPSATTSKRPAQRRLTTDQVAELVAQYQAGADMKALAVPTRDVVHAASRLSGVLPFSESWPRTVL